MNLIKLYEEILKTGMMSVDDEGLISQVKTYEADGSSPLEPAIIEGARLVLPTQYHIDNPDKKQKIIFHPLSENALQGESAIISKLKNMTSVSINMTMLMLVRAFLSLALSVDEHKKLSPDQSEVLSILKNADEKTEKDFMKLLLNGIKKEGSVGLFYKIFLKRGGSVMGKKYSRVGVVSFPIYEELSQDKTEYYGVSLRKKDQGVLKKLIEFILPNIGESHAYDQGSDDDNAPYLDALMQSVAGVATKLNKIIREFEDFIPNAKTMLIPLGWQKAFKDLNSFMPEVRRIPAQYGNVGSRKVAETMKDDINIQESVSQAISKPVEVQEKAKTTDSVPPWEDTPPQPQVAAQPMLIPQLSVNPVQSVQPVAEHKPGTISAAELLGITPGMMPMQGMMNNNYYPQGYPMQGQMMPMQGMMPGYQTMTGQPVYPQQNVGFL